MTIKEIINMCPNYDMIVNFICEEEDDDANDFIDYYREFVHSIPIELNKLKKLDEAMARYVKDHKFRKEINENVIDINVDVINKFYEDFIDVTTKTFGNTMWL